MTNKIRVLHYLNQFFGGIGGEEHANVPPEVQDGPVGPGRLLQSTLQAAGGGSVVATIVCGDNYIVENEQTAIEAIGAFFDRYKPDLVVAGPAFDAGRYGLGCALVCIEASARGIPSITGMHPENTGVLTHRLQITAVPTGAEASGMQPAIRDMASLGIRLAAGEELGPAVEEGYIPRGYRNETMHERNGADRAFDMMMARVNGEDYMSEVLVPGYETVSPCSTDQGHVERQHRVGHQRRPRTEGEPRQPGRRTRPRLFQLFDRRPRPSEHRRLGIRAHGVQHRSLEHH